MKKIVKILSLLLAFVFIMSVFTACGNQDVAELEPIYEDGKTFVTIQWMYGQKLLKEEVVEKGTLLASWTPEVEGKQFEKWYETPYVKSFDFKKPIAQSMRIYGKFVDSNDDNGPGGIVATEKVYLVLDSTWNDGSVVGAWVWPDGGDGQWVEATATEDANVFEMVLPEGVNNVVFADLNLGATDLGDSWSNRRAQTEDLVLPGASDDKVYFHVSNNSWSNSKTEPGEPVVGGGGNGGGNPDGIPEIIFIGSFSDPAWNTSNSDPQYALTKGEDGVWTGTLTLTQEESQLKLYDKGGKYGHDGGWIDPPAGAGENGNLVLSAGTYHFKYVEGETNFTHWLDGTDEPTGPVTPPAGSTKDIYFVAGAWTSDGAWFQAWTWGSSTQSNAWYTFEETDTPGTYKVTIPADSTGMKILRKGPEDPTNDWVSWNDSGDLVISGNCVTFVDWNQPFNWSTQ